MEQEAGKVKVATQTQLLVQKEAETERKRAVSEAEKRAAVATIELGKQLAEKENEKRVEAIDNDMHLARQKATPSTLALALALARTLAQPLTLTLGLALARALTRAGPVRCRVLPGLARGGGQPGPHHARAHPARGRARHGQQHEGLLRRQAAQHLHRPSGAAGGRRNGGTARERDECVDQSKSVQKQG